MVYRPSLLIGKLPKPPAMSEDRKQLSPTSPLELVQHSPKTWKRNDGEGIGLGIVASLEKNCVKTTNHHIVVPTAVCSRRLNLCQEFQKTESDFGKSSTTSDCKYGKKTGLLIRELSAPSSSMMIEVDEKFQNFQVADFLSNCYLCRKNLHGKDIYMYRGDKAFCSEECRYNQIVNDEYQEKRGAESFKSPEISSSPISDQLFFTGIIVS